MPVVIAIGGIFSLLCDNISRSLVPGEIPIGIFTAFLGSMLFIFLLMDKRKKMI
jgi:iron complex transport system permease protein